MELKKKKCRISNWNLAPSQAGQNEQVEPDIQTVSGVETMQGCISHKCIG